MHAQVERVTTRIIERSREGRAAYLARIDAMRQQGPARDVLGWTATRSDVDNIITSALAWHQKDWAAQSPETVQD